jgi:hypothetical protein
MYHKKFSLQNLALCLVVTFIVAVLVWLPVEAKQLSDCPTNVLANASFEQFTGDDLPSGWHGDAHSRHTSWITPADGDRYGWTWTAMWQDAQVERGASYVLSFFSATHGDVGSQHVTMSYFDKDYIQLGESAKHTVTHIVDVDSTFGGPYSLWLPAATEDVAFVRVEVSAATNWAKVDAMCLTANVPSGENETTEPITLTMVYLGSEIEIDESNTPVTHHIYGIECSQPIFTINEIVFVDETAVTRTGNQCHQKLYTEKQIMTAAFYDVEGHFIARFYLPVVCAAGQECAPIQSVGFVYLPVVSN